MACIADVVRRAPYPYDAIHIHYNHFINSISQKPKKLEIMNKAEFQASFNRLSIHEVQEPEGEFAQQFFYELYVAGLLIRRLLPRHAHERRLGADLPDERDGERLQKRR